MQFVSSNPSAASPRFTPKTHCASSGHSPIAYVVLASSSSKVSRLTNPTSTTHITSLGPPSTTEQTRALSLLLTPSSRPKVLCNPSPPTLPHHILPPQLPPESAPPPPSMDSSTMNCRPLSSRWSREEPRLTAVSDAGRRVRAVATAVIQMGPRD